MNANYINKELYEKLQIELREAYKLDSSEEREKKIHDLIKRMKECVKFEKDIDDWYEESVKYFIEKYNEIYNENEPEVASADFTTKGCYYFVDILRRVFGEETYIYGYDEHVVAKIKNNFYDIRGEYLKNIDKLVEYDEIGYDYFKDLCYLCRNQKEMEEFEKRCDKYLDKVLEDKKMIEYLEKIEEMKNKEIKNISSKM